MPRSLSARIALGLAAGVALGLFIGERASFLEVVADGYVKLLQMTVLPYVTVSIVGGLGALTPAQASTLGRRVGLVLLLVWAVGFAAVFLFPVMFPPAQNASFFSTTLLQERESFDFLNLYIPTNPFNSLANNIVPAVVLFSIVVGVGLIAVPRKARLLDVLAVASDAISRATHFVVALTPIGVFAIGAVVAGTLSIEDLARLQVYLISYVGMSLLLSLWVLPALVATLTPIPYRDLMIRSRDALVMAFMTTSLFAVLPLLTEQAKALIREHARLDSSGEAAADIVVPASFNFPHTGKLLSLSFLLFAGWFADTRIPLTEYPRLAGTGLLVMFGNVNAAVPFLLDLFHIPADTFRLFITSSVVNARFGTLLAAVHTLTVAVLGTCAVAGTLTIDRRKLVRFAIVTAVLTVAVVGGTRLLLQFALNRPYEKGEILSSMRMMRDRGTPKVFKSGEAVPPLAAATSVLERVRSRNVLRVGFLDDSLPYAFFNTQGELVGLDVEMALQLARDLGVSLELVPVSRSMFETGLDTSVCDLVMSGVVVTVERATRLQFSASYLDETMAFVVPDHLAAAFSDWSSIRAMRGVRIGVPNEQYFLRRVQDEIPNADIVSIDRIEDMFTPHEPPIDAFVMTAERGSAYTLLHPEYAVAVPKPRPLRVPLGYVIAGRDPAMTSLIDTWLEQKQKDSTLDELFAHWILGQDSAPRKPRWSVLDNVFGV